MAMLSGAQDQVHESAKGALFIEQVVCAVVGTRIGDEEGGGDEDDMGLIVLINPCESHVYFAGPRRWNHLTSSKH